MIDEGRTSIVVAVERCVGGAGCRCVMSGLVSWHLDPQQRAAAVTGSEMVGHGVRKDRGE